MKNEPNLLPLKILVIVMGIMLIAGGSFLLVTLYKGINDVNISTRKD